MGLAGGFELPGYLVFASIVYAMITTAAMILVGRHMAHVIERKNQAESELKFAVARLRATATATAEELPTRPSALVGFALAEVIRQWRRLCGQHVRTTLVSHGNTLLAPLIGLILCVPKYIDGAMSLGQVNAGGGGVCRRPRRLQLAGRQLSAIGRMGIVGQSRRYTAVRP